MSKLNSPVLIIGYNRYKNFKTLLNSLRFYKTEIYISIDGPKNYYDKVEQLKIVNLIKKTIIKSLYSLMICKFFL